MVSTESQQSSLSSSFHSLLISDWVLRLSLLPQLQIHPVFLLTLSRVPSFSIVSTTSVAKKGMPSLLPLRCCECVRLSSFSLQCCSSPSMPCLVRGVLRTHKSQHTGGQRSKLRRLWRTLRQATAARTVPEGCRELAGVGSDGLWFWGIFALRFRFLFPTAVI